MRCGASLDPASRTEQLSFVLLSSCFLNSPFDVPVWIMCHLFLLDGLQRDSIRVPYLVRAIFVTLPTLRGFKPK